MVVKIMICLQIIYSGVMIFLQNSGLEIGDEYFFINGLQCSILSLIFLFLGTYLIKVIKTNNPYFYMKHRNLLVLVFILVSVPISIRVIQAILTALSEEYHNWAYKIPYYSLVYCLVCGDLSMIFQLTILVFGYIK